MAKSSPTNTNTTKFVTVHIAHGGGIEKVEFANENQLAAFIQNVTKRDLQHFPWRFPDMHGNEYILRQFLFAKIVRH